MFLFEALKIMVPMLQLSEQMFLIHLPSMPPVLITVDYGDGSGEQIWSREEPALLWTHKYQLPGRYWVHVSSKYHPKILE